MRSAFHDDLASAVAGADLVIENVPENLQIKAEVYRALDALLPADTIVASDTSGMPITKLQAFMSNPARVVGMHWSNPPHIIPMIEVIAGEKTAPQTVDFIVRTIRELNLLPVVVKKDVPGFVENRVLYALLREAVVAGRIRRHRSGRPRYLRLLGHRLQARHRRADGAPRYGGPRHLRIRQRAS